MQECDLRRLQRERDIAEAVRGPNYRQRDEAIRKVKAAAQSRQQASDQEFSRRVAGFWDRVQRGEVGYGPGGVLLEGPPIR